MESDVLKNFPNFRGRCSKDHVVDFLGILYGEPYESIPLGLDDRYVETAHPEISEEFFEWIDILESVVNAENSYCMLELGAGFGRWGMRAWKAAKAFGISNPKIVLAEAEPSHAEWVSAHFSRNGVPKTDFTLINAAVSNTSGEKDFYVKKPGWTVEDSAKNWYGQAIVSGPWEGAESIKVKSISVDELMNSIKNPIIDLIDMDLQGEEAKVINQLLIHLNSIKTIHVGTHSKEIEAEIKKHLHEARWILKREFSIGETYEIDGTLVKFGDGVQTWKNPLFSK